VSKFRVDLTLRREDEAHVAVAGAVGSVETRQIATLVEALLAAGARQLIVDLDQVERCAPALTAFLDQQRHHLAAAGGWMIVDGAPSTPADDASSLVEIFDIYRHVHALNGSPDPTVTDRHIGATASS
jgi:hypothetical protein